MVSGKVELNMDRKDTLLAHEISFFQFINASDIIMTLNPKGKLLIMHPSDFR